MKSRERISKLPSCWEIYVSFFWPLVHLNKLFNCNWDYLLLIVPWAYAGRYLYVFLSGKDGTAKLNFLNMHTAMLCSSTQMHRGHSQNTLTKFCTLLTTYLPLIDIIKWRNSFTVIRENLHTVDIFSTTLVPTSSCQRSFWTTPLRRNLP